MKSNILFKSNVYPLAKGSFDSDYAFLGNVWDYNRLYSISKKISEPLPEIQATILREQPFCFLNKEDPCWGMTHSENGYKWVCRCTKADCERFEDCRADMPYIPEIDDQFIPRENVSDDYGYKLAKSEYDLYPIVTGFSTEGYCYDEKNIKQAAQRISVSMSSLSCKREDTEDIYAEQDLEKPVDSISDSFEEKRENSHDVIEAPDVETGSETAQIQESASQYNSLLELFVEDSQKSIITEQTDSLMFVDAGPGTGKTYTLIQKLNYMVTELGVNPEGIVVLCFTNAAVNEIRKRLQYFVQNGGDRGLINIDIRTFHSFAWWIISQANDSFCDDGWQPVMLQNLSYDESIKVATKVMSLFATDIFEEWEHFIVDEVQDLTGDLGRMVLQMVQGCKEAGCGITVLGDSCQAIYDYDSKDTLKSDQFYREMHSQLGDEAKYCSLTHNHRQTDQLVGLTTELRRAILSGDTETMRLATKTLMQNIESAESFEEDDSGNTCLLMRTNAQTLKFSSDLRKRGVAHFLNAAEPRNNYAKWIADVFGKIKGQTITKDQFIKACETKGVSNHCELWSMLTRLMHTDNNVLVIADLLDAIANSKIDNPSLRTSNDDNLIVSNIHRAKGREYDSVIIDSNYINDLAVIKNKPDEYRTLYVALTRPKAKLRMSQLQKKNKALYKIDIFKTRRSRWGSMKNGKIQYLEFDSNKDLLPEYFLNTDMKAFDDVCIGDEILLKRINSSELRYQIIHEKTDAVLGEITGPYILDYMYRMSLQPADYIQMPCTINDLYVSGIYAQVVDREYLEDHPQIEEHASNGVWKWLDIVGVGHASYDVY